MLGRTARKTEDELASEQHTSSCSLMLLAMRVDQSTPGKRWTIERKASHQHAAPGGAGENHPTLKIRNTAYDPPSCA